MSLFNQKVQNQPECEFIHKITVIVSLLLIFYMVFSAGL